MNPVHLYCLVVKSSVLWRNSWSKITEMHCNFVGIFIDLGFLFSAETPIPFSSIRLTHDVIPVDIEKECAVEQEKCTCVKGLLIIYKQNKTKLVSLVLMVSQSRLEAPLSAVREGTRAHLTAGKELHL